MQNDTNLVLTEAHSAEEVRNYTGSFCGFVLLSHSNITVTELYKNLKTQWGIEPLANGFNMSTPMDLMFDVPGAMVTVSLIEEPIPDHEAEMAAHYANWDGAQNAAQDHKAHLMVAVMPRELTPVACAILYCKVLSSCIAGTDVNNILAVYSSGMIVSPEYWRQATQAIDRNGVPWDVLIHVGTYAGDNGNGGYTVGLDAFGKDELEILDCAESEAEIRRVLLFGAKQIIEQDTQTGWYLRIVCDDVVWEGRRKDGKRVEGHSIQFQKVHEKMHENKKLLP